MEADDLVLAALEFLEDAADHARLEGPAVHRLEILLAGQVDDDRRGVGSRTRIEVVGDLLAPELVEVAALRRGQPGAHLQPVGLHQVQRAQHAVQAAQDAQVRLRPVEVRSREAFGVQPLVNIAVEGQHRLLGILDAGLRRPGLVTRHIEAGQRVRQRHQFADLRRGFLPEHLDQLGGLADEQRRRVRGDLRRRGEIQRFRRRE